MLEFIFDGRNKKEDKEMRIRTILENFENLNTKKIALNKEVKTAEKMR